MLVYRNQPVEHVYFPEGGVASIVSDMPDSGRTEVGIFGRDGVSATCLLLGSDTSPHDSFIQVDGATALRIDTDRYLAAIDRSGTLRTLLLRYVQTFLVQAAQSTRDQRALSHRIAARTLVVDVPRSHRWRRYRADARLHVDDDRRRA